MYVDYDGSSLQGLVYVITGSGPRGGGDPMRGRTYDETRAGQKGRERKGATSTV